MLTHMSPKLRFQILLEPGQLAALRAIEERVGVAIGEQVRRAIDAYLDGQKTLTKAELKELRRAK